MDNLSARTKVTGLVALGGLALATKYFLAKSNDGSNTSLTETPASRNSQEASRVQSNPYIEARNKRILNQRLITYIVVGAGNRGTVYGTYAAENPTIAKVVGVVEPNKYRRERFLNTHKHTIPEENIFTDWTILLQREKLADVAVVTTPDAMHTDIAIGLAKLGYHILVEKPMAIKEEDCGLIAKAVHENNVILAVGHVMRYTPYTQKIKEIVSSGLIGDVVNMSHVEPVGHWHFAHSYVRGNWRNQEESTFSLMAKSCHDIDWIRYIMGSKCTRISSFGSLKHFNKQNKPKEAENASRCLDCKIQNDCVYSATRIYLDRVKKGHKTWPVNVIVNADPDIESVTDALKNGPYGRCAYECDNNVCDNQVVNMQFENGTTASFSMIAYSEEICVRKTRIYGTLGELELDGKSIRMVDFRDPKLAAKRIVPESEFTFSKMAGHGGGDWYLMDSFVAAVALNDPTLILSGPEETLESHLLVFAAEKSRLENTVVNTESLTSKYIY